MQVLRLGEVKILFCFCQICAQVTREWLYSNAGKKVGQNAGKWWQSGQTRGFGNAPKHEAEQADFLRELNLRGRAADVVNHFEGGKIAATEGTVAEYVKALVKMDRLDQTQLLTTITVRACLEKVLLSSVFITQETIMNSSSQSLGKLYRKLT